MLTMDEYDLILEQIMGRPEDEVLLSLVGQLRDFRSALESELIERDDLQAQFNQVTADYEKLRSSKVDQILGRQSADREEAEDTTANPNGVEAEPEIVDEGDDVDGESVELDDIFKEVKDEEE